jgi:hypothetical protein
MDKVDDQVLATLASVDQTSGGLLSVLIAETDDGDRLPVAVLSRCVIVSRAHRGDGGQDHARRTPAHALTLQ